MGVEQFKTFSDLRRAAEIIDTLIAGSDCAAISETTATLTMRIPVRVLDDAFALLGSLEDLEDDADREAGYQTVLGTMDMPRIAGVGDDHEPEEAW